MLSQTLNLCEFCSAVMHLPLPDVLSAASAEVSELRRNRKVRGSPSNQQSRLQEQAYSDDLMSLIRVLMGNAPSELRPGFENDVRRLLIQLNHTVRIDSDFVRQVISAPGEPAQTKPVLQASEAGKAEAKPTLSNADQAGLARNPVKSIGSWLVLTGILLLYAAAVWGLLAHVPALSVAARVRMTPRLWLYDVAGFLFGAFVGSSLVFHVLAIFDYGRVHRRSDQFGTAKTAIGLIISILLMNAISVYFANAVVNYGLRHP